MMKDLLRYRDNIYSQNGEDGILAELLRRVGISEGWCCEFGAWDGRYLSNTYRLLEAGWRGVMIEGDRQRANDLELLAGRFDGRLFVIPEFVADKRGSQSLDSLLARTPIPRDFAVLSVDVDGPDYQIWETLQDYQPLFVIIEVNGHYPPGVEHVHTAEQLSSSFSSMVKLGASKGYVPLVHTGNIFFVREERYTDCCRSAGSRSTVGSLQFLYTERSAMANGGHRFEFFAQRIAKRIDLAKSAAIRRMFK